MTILALYNSKGGVGKSSCAVNLAAISALSGFRVLLWDLDPQGAASFFLNCDDGLEQKTSKLVSGKRDWTTEIRSTMVSGLHLIPGDMDLRNLDLMLEAEKHSRRVLVEWLKPLKEQYDLIVLDCPPGLTLLTENLFRAVDGILVPVTPSHLGFRTYEQVKSFLAAEDRDPSMMKPFISMADKRKKTHRDLIENPPQDFLKASVPLIAEIEHMGSTKQPSVLKAGSKSQEIFGKLWEEVRLVFEVSVTPVAKGPTD